MIRRSKRSFCPAARLEAALEHYGSEARPGRRKKSGGPSGYLPGKYFASFIGFPPDEPEVCISIMLDEPKHGYYGGQVAAPVFKQIAERLAGYLNINPEDGETLPGTGAVTVSLDNRTFKTAAARSQ